MPRNIKNPTIDGITYRSGFEGQVAQWLKSHNIPFEYENYTFEYMEPQQNGKCLSCGSSDISVARWYLPDFYLPRSKLFIEVKGKFDQDSRRKMKLVCEQSTEDIRILFQRNAYLTKKKSMTYGRWCELNGIKYASGVVPLDWIRKC